MKTFLLGLTTLSLMVVLIVGIFEQEFYSSLEQVFYVIICTNFIWQLGSAIFRVIRKKGASRSDDNKPSSTVVDLLFSQKTKEYAIAYALLFSSLVSYAIYLFIFSDGTESLIHRIDHRLVLFFGFLFLAVYINERVLKYRIDHGFYGMNNYEAREILTFIMAHTDKTHFIDGHGLKIDVLPPRVEQKTHEGEITPSAEEVR